MTDLLRWFSEPYGSSFMRNAGLVAVLIGILAPTVGVWVVLRRIITPFMLVALVPFIVAEAWPTRRSLGAARLMTGAGLAAFLFSSAYFAVHYETLYDSHRNFDRMTHFDR